MLNKFIKIALVTAIAGFSSTYSMNSFQYTDFLQFQGQVNAEKQKLETIKSKFYSIQRGSEEDRVAQQELAGIFGMLSHLTGHFSNRIYANNEAQEAFYKAIKTALEALLYLFIKDLSDNYKHLAFQKEFRKGFYSMKAALQSTVDVDGEFRQIELMFSHLKTLTKAS